MKTKKVMATAVLFLIGLPLVALFQNMTSSQMTGPSASQRWQAQTDSIYDPVVFQWQFYLDLNPDLRSAGVLTEQQAKNHWRDSGINEGRYGSPGFNVRDYLDLNADVAAAVGAQNYGAALRHYLTSGRIEGRAKSQYQNYGFDRGYGDSTIGNEEITVRTTAAYAGAITDLIFRGFNYVNNHDDGRLFQSDYDYDAFYECANPTEAGNAADFTGPSHSNLFYTLVQPGVLRSSVHPAYWSTPHATYACGIAQGTSAAAPSVISKLVEMDAGGDRQIIHWKTTVAIGEAHEALRVESQAAYFPLSLGRAFVLNTTNSRLEAVTPAEIGIDTFQSSLQTYPPIYTNADGSQAIGIVATAQTSAQTPTPGSFTYALGKYSHGLNDPTDGTVKTSVYYSYSHAAAGNYESDSYIVVGTLTEVYERMVLLTNAQNPSNLVAIFRFRNPVTGEHFFTASQVEGLSSGFTPEGVGFWLYPGSASGRLALYRCFAVGLNRHFISSDPACEGQRVEGRYGYSSGAPTPEANAALGRYFNSKSIDHLETTNAPEALPNGYLFETSLGFTPVGP